MSRSRPHPPTRQGWGRLAASVVMVSLLAACASEPPLTPVSELEPDPPPPAPVVEPPPPPPVPPQALKGLAKQPDAPRAVTWYRHASVPSGAQGVPLYAYFGVDDVDRTATPLHLALRYEGARWLFVERVWAKADGQTVELPQPALGLAAWERGRNGKRAWESAEVLIDGGPVPEALRQLVTAKKVSLAFKGQSRTEEMALTPAQLTALRDTLTAYRMARGDVPPPPPPPERPLRAKKPAPPKPASAR